MSLPRIYGGRRRALIGRLVLNGAGQGVVSFGLAYLLRSVLRRSSHLDADLWPWLVTIAASGIVMIVLRSVEAADAERLGQDYVMRVRLRIFGAVARRSAAADRRGRWGVTMTRLISDLNSLRNWVSAGIARSIVASITLVGVGVALAWTHPVALVALGVMVGISGASAWALLPILRRYVREARRRRGRLANNLGEKMLAAGTVRQFDNTRSELRRVRTHSLWLRDALVRRVRLAQVMRRIPRAAVPVAIAVLIGLAGPFDFSAADITVSVMLLGLAGSSLSDLARALDYRLAFEEGRARIDDVLAARHLKEARKAVELPPGGPVSVRVGRVGVRARLDAGPFRASPGQTVWVTGPDGSGKSTLLALIARWLDPDSGRIELDDVPVRRLSFASLAMTVQLVTPEVPLLRGSVLDNLTYGFEDPEDEWVAKVCTTCDLGGSGGPREELMEMRVEEQGRNLPEGLRARIVLARAAVAAPRLLLIDHPVLLTDPKARVALRRIIDLLGCTALVAGPNGPPLVESDAVWRLDRGDADAGAGVRARAEAQAEAPGEAPADDVADDVEKDS